jgi:hypothetical protein
MNSVDMLAGLACLGIGVSITIVQIKTFSKGKQDQLGFDIKLLSGGVIFIIIGIMLTAKAF